MKRISYSDNILLKRLCDELGESVRQKKDRAATIRKIESYVEKTRKRANGYWKLPEGKKALLESLTVISQLLRNNATSAELHEIYNEFTSKRNNASNKCRITFLAQEYAVWPSLEGVYDVMARDPRFEVTVVHVPFHHPNSTGNDNSFDLYKADNIPVIRFDQYDLSEDNPDVVFFSKPYGSTIPGRYYIAEVEKVADKTVYVSYGMETSYKLILYGFQHYLHYSVWRHIVYGEYAKRVGIQYGYRNGENIVVWGHPKMDYFLTKHNISIPDAWSKKIDGRRVICWCPHHTILPGDAHISTWLNYQAEIFNWIDNHQEAVLLWRPHPLLFGALVNNKYMTQSQLDEMLEEKKWQSNIIYDDNSDYHLAFEVSDAMVTDGSSFSLEYLGTGKPLMLTTDDITQYYNYEEAQKGLYIGDSVENVIAFFENVLEGEDPKKEAREMYIKKTIFSPVNKSISEYIADNILHDLIEEQINLVKRLCE